jgi:SAM-dependent methyltransferase
MNIFDWIKKEFEPASCSSAELIYDKMESQSDFCLPLIYKPFDINNRAHWRDRGWAFDFLYATGGGKLLDFGPGDGWPTLIVAPFAEKVVGLDVSLRRIEVCTANAKRMGISNAEFVTYQPEQKVPFENNSFDGIMAASSVEETDNPKEILREFYRVLRPGGRLRIFYEGLNKYKNGGEHDLWLQPLDRNRCLLILSNRLIDKERMDMYGLTIDMSEEKIQRHFSNGEQPLGFDSISIKKLENIRSFIIESKLCSIPHPSGKTLQGWLQDSGFDNILPTHNGADAAGKLFNLTPEKDRPPDMDSIDKLIRPLAEIAVSTLTPIETDPVITAVKPDI